MMPPRPFSCWAVRVWTDARQTLLEASLQRAPRPVYVGNPDIVAPRENGFSTEPGSFAHRLADETGVSPQFLWQTLRQHL